MAAKRNTPGGTGNEGRQAGSTDRRQAVGRRGEDIAAAYLEARGYRVIGRNIRCELGELDLVAMQDEYLVFVEVKTRARMTAYHPTLAITAAKKQKLRELGAWFLAHHPTERPMQPRFDVVTVVLAPGRKADGKPDEAQVEHYPNAL